MQVVPNCSPVSNDKDEVSYSVRDLPIKNKDRTKLLDLFSGDDIFAHHEE